MSRFSRFVVAVVLLATTWSETRGQDVAEVQPEGTQGLYCRRVQKGGPTLFRQHDFFFCAAKPSAWPAKVGYAAIGPDQKVIEAAIGAAFDTMRPLTRTSAEISRDPDLAIVQVPPDSDDGEAIRICDNAPGIAKGARICRFLPRLTGPVDTSFSETGSSDGRWYQGTATSYKTMHGQNAAKTVYGFLRVERLLAAPPVPDARGMTMMRYLHWLAAAKQR